MVQNNLLETLRSVVRQLDEHKVPLASVNSAQYDDKDLYISQSDLAEIKILLDVVHHQANTIGAWLGYYRFDRYGR